MPFLAKDNGVTSTSDGRTHEFLQPVVSEASLLPSISPSTSIPVRGEMRTPPGRSFSESPHDSMVSSTSNLAASPAQQHQDSEAASVLLYQSSHTGKDPRQWNVQEVSNFMVSIGCSNYAEAFTKEVYFRMLFISRCYNCRVDSGKVSGGGSS